MAKVAGSLWVETTELHYCDKNTDEWYFVGTDMGLASGSVVGSVWVDTNTICYIDTANHQRAVATVLVASRSGVGAISGSIWVQTSANVNYSLSIIEASASKEEREAHSDSHDDVTVTFQDVHSDVAHSDIAAHDDHGDQHLEGYYDIGGGRIHHDTHDDDHSDLHGDSGGHGDTHSDSHGDEFDAHHFDHHSDTHNDSGGHSDSHADVHGDGHDDFSHADAHTNIGHTDTHTDTHTDVHASHTDITINQPTSLGQA